MPTANVKKILTMPEGVLRSAECGGVNPKPLIRVAEYVVTTPEDTDVYRISCQHSLPPLVDNA